MQSIDRRQFVLGVAAGFATAAVSPVMGASQSGATAPQSGTTPASLSDPVFRPLPLGSVKPEGWLRRQLRQQADGLSGHLDEFWGDVGQSQWFGGKAEGWERAPYWLDGVIPLAWVLCDAGLQSKVKGYVEKIVAGQRSDGWYAPYPADASAKPYDLWSILLVNKALGRRHPTGGARLHRAH